MVNKPPKEKGKEKTVFQQEDFWKKKKRKKNFAVKHVQTYKSLYIIP